MDPPWFYAHSVTGVSCIVRITGGVEPARSGPMRVLDAEAAQLTIQGVGAAAAAGQAGGEDHALSVRAEGRDAVRLAGGGEGQQDGRAGHPVVGGD